jgi:hypothetical protein
MLRWPVYFAGSGGGSASAIIKQNVEQHTQRAVRLARGENLLKASA